MCDLFLFISESNVANYADDTNLYACEKNLYDVKRKSWKEVAKKVRIWIFNTILVVPWVINLKANGGKSHLMLTTDNKLMLRAVR